MTDAADVLFAEVADEVTRRMSAPPYEQVLARSRRHRRRLGVPVATLPYAAMASVVLAVVAVVVVPRVLAERGGTGAVQADFAGGAPELGTVPFPEPLPTGPRPERGADFEPAPGTQAVLLAQATTRLGTSQLLGYTSRAGARCELQAYSKPFLNSVGPGSCTPRGQRPPRTEPITTQGMAEGTPGAIKSPPLVWGSAPPGTRIVELSSPELATLRVPAHDAGDDYGHGAFFMATWPFAVPSVARALSEDGRVLASVQFGDVGPQYAESLCDGVRAVTLSHLQGASIDGKIYAKDHPDSADPVRLQHLDGGPGTSPSTVELPDAVVLKRLRRAYDAIGVMGPEETYEYRQAAVVLIGDGKDCYGAPVVELAQRFFDDSA